MQSSAMSIAPPWNPATLFEKVSSPTESVPLPRSSMAPPDLCPRSAWPPLIVMRSMVTPSTLVVSIVTLLPDPPLSSVGNVEPVLSMLSESPPARRQVDDDGLVVVRCRAGHVERDVGVRERLGGGDTLLDRLAGPAARRRAPGGCRAVDVVDVERGRRRRGGRGARQARRRRGRTLRTAWSPRRPRPLGPPTSSRAGSGCPELIAANSDTSLRSSSSPTRRGLPDGQPTFAQSLPDGYGS